MSSRFFVHIVGSISEESQASTEIFFYTGNASIRIRILCRWSLRTRIGTISVFSPCQITLCRAFALSPPHWLRWSLYWAISFPTFFPCTWILLKLLFLLSITCGPSRTNLSSVCVRACVRVCWCGGVHRCDHAEMYVLAISVPLAEQQCHPCTFCRDPIQTWTTYQFLSISDLATIQVFIIRFFGF